MLERFPRLIPLPIQGERLPQVEQEPGADAHGPAKLVEGLERALNDAEPHPVLAPHSALDDSVDAADGLRHTIPRTTVGKGLLDERCALGEAPAQHQCRTTDAA